jgi:acyl carrier protein
MQSSEMTQTDLGELIVSSINRARAQAGKDELTVTHTTALLGDDAVLDSVAFVMLVVDLDHAFAAKFGVAANLSEHEALLDPDGPFRTAGDLQRHLQKVIG